MSAPKRNQFQLIILLLLLAANGAAIFLIPKLPALERSLAEQALNRNANDLFEGAIRVGRVAIDGHLRLRLEGIRGSFKTRQGPVPLEVRSIASRDSLLLLLTQRPVRFTVDGIRPAGSPRKGANGEFSFRAGKAWRFELAVDLNDTDLEDVRWIDPQNLAGAAGAARGKISFVQSAGSDPVFAMNLEAPEPGGVLQADFFDIFLPYLPASVEKEKVSRLISTGKRLVKYKTAGLQVAMPQSDRMKVLLRILVLDYNLKLTLNADIRTDSKDTFFQIARIMGLIEVK
jgi:hypothetical protein